MKFYNKRIVRVIVFTGIFAGCATTKSFEDTYGTWVGGSISDFEKVYKQTVPIGAKGDCIIYKCKIEGKRDCTIYWIVDRNGTIVGWRHEGCDCQSVMFEL